MGEPKIIESQHSLFPQNRLFIGISPKSPFEGTFNSSPSIHHLPREAAADGTRDERYIRWISLRIAWALTLDHLQTLRRGFPLPIDGVECLRPQPSCGYEKTKTLRSGAHSSPASLRFELWGQ